METQIIDLTQGASAVGSAVGGSTQIIAGGSTTETGANFTGGLLQLHEQVAGWEVTSKLGTLSGEADIYIAQKDEQKGVVKYYRSTTKPKTEILEKLKMLNHPDIVNVYDFGMYNERFYEIMEYAEGGALDTRNADGSYRYLPLSEEKVEGICKEIVNSFKTCHEKGIIHRDIKPANIYYRTLEIEEIDGGEGAEKKTVYKGDDVVIADFGISSIMEDTEQLHKTRTGSRTTGYAAPEVLSGIITNMMDYYALGITLWELLTGKDPFTLDNGKRRNDAHLIRDTIEGRIADDILSKEPRVSKKMERLIRGLLVIDHERRWGYNEVMRHLAGENVDFYQEAKKSWSLSVGGVQCTTLEDLGTAIVEAAPEVSNKFVFGGRLASFLEKYYPDIAKQITQVAEESSAANDQDNGILKVACLLNPALPLKFANGYKMQNLDDLNFLLENAPESVIPQLRDAKSKLYSWLEIMGYKGIAAEIKKLPGIFSGGMGNTELAGKAEVLLKNKVIKPFKLAKYADFELSTLVQIRKVPKDMQRRILILVEEKSYEGLFLPWFELLSPGSGASTLLTEYFGLPVGAKSAQSAGNKLLNQLNAQISTQKPCEIDKTQSQIKKDQLISHSNNSSYSVELSIKTDSAIPDNVTEFWYFVRVKSAGSAGDPWVEAKELASVKDMKKITIDDYKKRGEILFSTTAKDENAYYVTMFTVFEVNGKKSISLPSKMRFDRRLDANVYWKVTKPIIGKSKLSIEIKPNRSLTRLPKFILCASLQGQHLEKSTDGNSKILMEIQEQELDAPVAVFKKDYEIVSPEFSQVTKNSKLFLFVTSPVPSECYSLRWAENFKGKI
ncbi:serine/threonine protein kinase [Treponema sp. R8-4-B8]